MLANRMPKCVTKSDTRQSGEEPRRTQAVPAARAHTTVSDQPLTALLPIRTRRHRRVADELAILQLNEGMCTFSEVIDERTGKSAQIPVAEQAKPRKISVTSKGDDRQAINA
jgi:hypothetical protein